MATKADTPETCPLIDAVLHAFATGVFVPMRWESHGRSLWVEDVETAMEAIRKANRDLRNEINRNLYTIGKLTGELGKLQTQGTS